MPKHQTVTVVRDSRGLVIALQQSKYELRVISGPSKGLSKKVSSPRLVVGSAAGSGFELKDPTVSAVHCEILAGEHGFRLRDLGSKNGTRLAGRRLGEAWLENSDTFTLGKSSFKFEVLSERFARPLTPEGSFGKLRGSSPAMREVYVALRSAAASDAALLLTGETGTGKELAAEAVMEHGARRHGPLVVVDCGGLSPSLGEAELFGHTAGAFTGATRDMAGAFERASGGTLFLDGVAELPSELQAKLLGVLGRRTVQRLGGEVPIAVDMRVISSTQRALGAQINRGAFRADLYYRLAGLEIRLPPLREHPEDIPELVASMLTQLSPEAQLSPRALERLYSGDYPGNVRELRSAVERAATGLELPTDQRCRPAEPTEAPTAQVHPFRQAKHDVISRFEREYLAVLLKATGGNVSEASRQSGIDRVHLYRLLKAHGLDGRGQP
jgi:DNA-binding NtrC family response regulator